MYKFKLNPDGTFKALFGLLELLNLEIPEEKYNSLPEEMKILWEKKEADQ